MPRPDDPDARRYLRVAHQRLEDGRLIVEQLDRPQAAIYLTGYAVECGLKSLLIERTPPGRRGAILDTFRVKAAHDLVALRHRLLQVDVIPPHPIGLLLIYVSSWSTELRYDPPPGDTAVADQFLASTRDIVAWVDRSI